MCTCEGQGGGGEVEGEGRGSRVRERGEQETEAVCVISCAHGTSAGGVYPASRCAAALCTWDISHMGKSMHYACTTTALLLHRTAHLAVALPCPVWIFSRLMPSRHPKSSITTYPPTETRSSVERGGRRVEGEGDSRASGAFREGMIAKIS